MSFIKDALGLVLSHGQWLLLAWLAFSIWITRRICARWDREAREKRPRDKESAGARWFGYFIVFTLFSFLSMGSLLMPVAIGERLWVFATGTASEATITGFNSRSERVTREDSNKRRYSETVTMHTPVYAFTLPDGRALEMEGDYSSEQEPEVGETQRIFFDTTTGRLVTASASMLAMLMFGTLFSMLLVAAMYATLRYAFRRQVASL